MAKHRKHHHKRRRHFRDYRTAPFGLNLDALKGTVGVSDVLVGASAGLAAAGLLKGILMKGLTALKITLPTQVAPAVPGVAAAAAGIGLYFAEKKSARAKGHLIGALGAGAAIGGWEVLKVMFPAQFNDYVSVPGVSAYYPQYNGVIVDSPPGQLQAFNGVIVDSPAAQLQAYSRFEDLQRSAMGEPDFGDAFSA